MKTNHIYNENCLDTMKRMEDAYVDLTVTSPPYDNLRTYNGYSFPFEEIAQELYRVTKEGGVLVWVVNDATIDGDETGTSFRQALYLKECGFKLHDTMIYQKTGCAMPSPNRYLANFEYMFVFCKGKIKTYNLIEDRPNRFTTRWGEGRKVRKADGSWSHRKKYKPKEIGRRFNVWRYNNGGQGYGGDAFSDKHPAPFPERLAGDHIISWSNKGDLVYDPFMGSGTTAKMCVLNERNFIGSEMSSEYCGIIEERLSSLIQYQPEEKNTHDSADSVEEVSLRDLLNIGEPNED